MNLNCTSCIIHMGSMAKGICISLKREREVNAVEESNGFPITDGYREKHTNGTICGTKATIHSTPIPIIHAMVACCFSSTLRMS